MSLLEMHEPTAIPLAQTAGGSRTVNRCEEESMLLEILLLLALCVGVPVLVARCISYGGGDES